MAIMCVPVVHVARPMESGIKHLLSIFNLFFGYTDNSYVFIIFSNIYDWIDFSACQTKDHTVILDTMNEIAILKLQSSLDLIISNISCI